MGTLGLVLIGVAVVVISLLVQAKVMPYTWYIDARDGDDDNPSHSRSRPLRTHEEFLRRLRNEWPVIRHRHTIYAQGSRNYHLVLDVDVRRDGLVFDEKGSLRYVTPRGIHEVRRQDGSQESA